MTVRANGTPELRVNNNYFQSLWDLGREKQWADFYAYLTVSRRIPRTC